MRRTTRCPDCGRDLLWTVTEAGKRLAVDPEPNPVGNAAVYRDGTGTWRSRRPSAELPLAGWERLHMPHVATCPAQRPAPELPPDVVELAAHRRRTLSPGRSGQTASSVPVLGRCLLCGHARHVSAHRSRRDGLLRLLCTPCYSTATVTEESGHAADWHHPRPGPADGDQYDGLFPPQDTS
ncbi:hypothetical protein AB4Z54_24200 [Streptomyces sp. MCAF7]